MQVSQSCLQKIVDEVGETAFSLKSFGLAGYVVLKGWLMQGNIYQKETYCNCFDVFFWKALARLLCAVSVVETFLFLFFRLSSIVRVVRAVQVCP